MSSAATLAGRPPVRTAGQNLSVKDLVEFGIPLFANIHLCGSVLTEVFFCYDNLQNPLWCSSGAWRPWFFSACCSESLPLGLLVFREALLWHLSVLITGVLRFDETGTALMLTIFALQDSFGTACNVTGDGALTLILTGYARYHNIREQKLQ